MRFSLLILLSACVCLAGAQSPSKDAMKTLRKTAITQPAAKWKFKRDKAFPTTFGVVVDFPIGSQTATVVSLRDGTTSLYTTSTFGIIGGGTHPTVRKASIDLIKLAETFWTGAKATRDTSCPSRDHVRFYLLGYDGVRYVETTTQSLSGPSDRYKVLWTAANQVLTELRNNSGIR